MAFPTVPPGQWVSIAGSSLADPAGNPAAPQAMFRYLNQYLHAYVGGNASPNGIWAYGGFTFDTLRNRIISAANGGHADYSGNEVYEFDLEGTQTWTMTKGPTFTTPTNRLIPLNPGESSTDVYTDTPGTYGPPGGLYPASRHSYYGNVFMPTVGPNGTVWVTGGSRWWDGNVAGQVWYYDPVALTWALQSQGTSEGLGIIAVWDPHKRVVLYHGKNFLRRYDPAQPDGLRITTLSVDEADWTGSVVSGFFDTRRRRFVLFGVFAGNPYPTPGLAYYDLLSSTPYTLQRFNPSGTWPNLAGRANPGGDYDALRDRYVFWIGEAGLTQRVYVMDPDTLVTSTLTLTGATPPEHDTSGTFNRFLYYPPQDVYLLFNKAMQTVHVACHPDVSRRATLALKTWTAAAYPASGSDIGKVNANENVKHTTSVTDESRGVVVIACGDTRYKWNTYNATLDSATSLGTFDMGTGTWGYMKRVLGPPPTEWQLDRSDNGPFGWVPPGSGTALDDKYFWIPGFQGASQKASRTKSFAAPGDDLRLYNHFSSAGGQMLLSAGTFVGILATDVDAGVLGTGTILSWSGTTLTFSATQAFAPGDPITMSQSDGGSVQNTIIVAGSGTVWTTSSSGSATNNIFYRLSGTWVPALFYDFDTDSTAATITFGTANPYTYRSILNGGYKFWRVRVSSYTSGSASCLLETGETLDQAAWAAGALPRNHGKPLPLNQWGIFDPALSSPSGSGRWIATPVITSPYGGDGGATGQGRYDPVTKHFYHLVLEGGINRIVGFDCVGLTYPAGKKVTYTSLLAGSAIARGNLYRGRLALDIKGRRGYFICPQSTTVARLGYVNLDTMAIGFASATAIPNWRDDEFGGTHQIMDFDPVNRVVMIPIVSAMGGTVYDFSVYHVDRDAWETFPITSGDFPAGIKGNECCYDTYHGALLVYGGSGGTGTAAGLWRYAGGPSTATPTFNPVPVLTTLVPNTLTVGSSAFTMNVFGTNFIASSSVRWNGGARATTYVSSTTLLATVLATDLLVPTTASVTVNTPAPGGGTSNALPFTVTAALQAGTFVGVVM